MFKTLTILVSLLLFCFTAFTQSPARIIDRKGQWLYFDNVNISEQEFISDLHSFLTFNKNSDFKLSSVNQDDLGMNHQIYQQYAYNIPIDNACIYLHSRDNKLITVTDKTTDFNFENPHALISKEESIEAALTSVHAEQYAWQDIFTENLIKDITGNLNSSYYPNPELIWYNTSRQYEKPNFKLAYKMDIYSLKPLDRKWIFVSAEDGSIIDQITKMCDINVKGKAHTKYLGEQEIITDSIATDTFILRDYTRGNGIITLNGNRGQDFTKGVDFIDNDNDWDNVNAFQDEIATDAHYGAEMTYDYYKSVHNRKSIDNNDFKLTSVVHYDNKYNNARWTGEYMIYGDGDGTEFAPFTILDVCGHEVSHGFTEKSSGLVYRDESGALNESMSDIFGISVSNWALNPDTLLWYIGKGLYVKDPDKALRNMANPWDYQNPKYYKGLYWYTGTGDNGGVHTNSGVQNYWYYLITMGEKGKNEKDIDYDIKGIGLNNASKIAYRMNTVYLTKTSTYADAYAASERAAIDLFGNCSPEHLTVLAAWYAVGLTTDQHLDADIRYDDKVKIKSACDLTANEKVNYSFRYNACNNIIPKGTIIELGILVDGKSVADEFLTLDRDLSLSDLYSYDFKKRIDLSQNGVHEIKIWHVLPGDPIHNNDTLTYNVEKYDPNFIDFALRASTSSGIINVGCGDPGVIRGSLFTKFTGCADLLAGTEIPITVIVNGVSSTGKLTISKNITRGDSVFSSFTIIPNKLLNLKANSAVIYVKYPSDAVEKNDTIKVSLNRKYDWPRERLFTSTVGQTARDTVNLIPNRQAISTISGTRSIIGNSIYLSGGIPTSTSGLLIPPTNEAEIWTTNEAFKGKACFCMNADSMDNVFLRFKIKQFVTPTNKNIFPNADQRFLDATRILINGAQFDNTIYLDNLNDTNKIRILEYNLNQYKGQKFEVCFENFACLSSNIDQLYGGDGTWIDDVILTQKSAVANHDVSIEKVMYHYPNPGKDFGKLIIPDAKNGKAILELVDPLGKLILQKELLLSSNYTSYELDYSSINPGIYTLSVFQDNAFYKSLKIVIQK